MRSTHLGFSLLLLLIASNPAPGQATARVEPPKRFDLGAIETYVREVVELDGLTGLSLAIAREGRVVLARGFGKRSIEAGTPVVPETAFAIGSVTKQFACACIFLLAEDGKLSVLDPVAKYFPELTRADKITLYQLMTHTSGYPDYYPLDFVDRRMLQPIAPDALIRAYAGGKLDFEPGARWSYSNTGYVILGRVVEKVAGVPFGDFLRERILNPLKMEQARFEPMGTDDTRARGYLPFALGAPEPASPEATGWLHAAGGLWASAPDLLRWDLALMEGRVLKPESIRAMTAPVVLGDGRSKDYGCGLAVRREAGETTWSHGGAVSGFRATNVLIPRTKSAVVVLVNDEQSDPGLAQTIAGLLLKEEAPVEVPKVAGPPPQEAALAFFRSMQAGQLDREGLGEEFSAYLTTERVRVAADRLKAMGEPTKVEVTGSYERGGMEVSSIRLSFATATALRGLLYRSADGKIQQLLFEKAR